MELTTTASAIFFKLRPPPFISAVCINPSRAIALPEITAQACIVLGFMSRLDTGFSEENEPVVSEGAIRDSYLRDEASWFCEDIREITIC